MCRRAARSSPLLGQGRNPGWRVVYAHGEQSVPMCRRTAKDYAAIFGGRVERIRVRKSLGRS